MNWGNITQRDMDFERVYRFDASIDYEKEIEEYNRYNKEQDWEGRQRFIIKHSGIIAYWAKVAYFKELKAKGLL